MQWSELCEKAEAMGYTLCFDDHDEWCQVLEKNGLCFFEKEKIKTDMGDVVSKDRTYNQMYAIMELLK